MIGPYLIADRLQRYLPVVSDIFGEQITATASASGNTVTVTSNGHGFTVGRAITVAAGSLQNNIVSFTDNGDGTARFETQFDHDLTEPKRANDPTTLVIGGTGIAEWDATHTIESVPNRRFFEVAIPDGAAFPSSGYLSENRSLGINGIQTVATVPDADTFTFDVEGPTLPTGQVFDIKVLSGARVQVVADVQRAEKIYTQQNADDAVVFVIMTDANASKDRTTLNDGILNATQGTDKKLTILNNFSLAVFLPCQNNSGAAEQQNAAYTTILQSLLKVLYGAVLQPDRTKFGCVLTGHGPGVYNTGYYSHVYDWQVQDQINFTDGFDMQEDVAFRDIGGTFDVNEGGLITLSVDLDKEPIV